MLLLPLTILSGVFLLLYVISVCIYRVTRHPLAKYPGPWLAKLTDMYSAYHAYVGDIQLDMWGCHEKYGQFVRYGPNKIIANNAEAFKDVYGHGKNFRKSRAYEIFERTPGAFSTHSSIDKTIHGRKRKILGHGFSESAMKSAEDHILERVRMFCKQLGQGSSEETKGWSSPKNMALWSNYLTFDVMAALVFNQSFQLLENEENHFVIDAISNSARRSGILFQFPNLHSYMESKFGWDKLLLPGLTRGSEKLVQLASNLSSERASMEDRKDILWHVENAKDPETGEGFSRAEMTAEAILLIAAGSDTSSTTIAATIFYLTRHPAAYEQVTSEIRSKFLDVEAIRSGLELSSCNYLLACIEETMRMSPPVGGAMWRETQRDGANVSDEFIPEASDVGVGLYALHHNSKYFPDPFTYKPERWIVSDSNTKDDVEAAKAAFGPFSIGSRGCIGKTLAYTEVKLALARLLYLYDVRLAKGAQEGFKHTAYKLHVENEYQLIDSFASQKYGPWVEYRARSE